MEILLTNKSEKPAGFMIPIPQYPFYTATIDEFDAKPVKIYNRILLLDHNLSNTLFTY